MANDADNLLERGLESIHKPLNNFIRAQTTSSLILFLATVIALWWANSSYADFYQNLIHTPLGFIVGDYQLHATFKHIMNDGLMVIFFFALGLEIKREIIAGDLSHPGSRKMLIFCAVGGMLAPSLIYLFFNWSLESQIGWGVPMATDTAFALGVLVLVRKHIPAGLLAFIVGLAIVDDIGAVLVIAIFYSEQISVHHLLLATGFILLLAISNYAGVRQPVFYLAVGIATWWMVLKSGIHPTFAGVMIALTVPARPKTSSQKLLKKARKQIRSIEKELEPVDVLGNEHTHEQVLKMRDYAERATTPLRRWENALELPIAIFILPLFALTNAGIPFSTSSLLETFTHPAGIGIISGLVIGKFIGISGTCWIALRFKFGHLPDNVNFRHIIGTSLIAGIGFTMSTFMATLSFDTQPENLHIAKTSIIIASVFAAVLGLLFIRLFASTHSSKLAN